VITDDVTLGPGVVIHHPDLVNLYGCEIGEGTAIGPFVEIQRGASIGSRCKISSHSFICTGVEIGSGVFVGHGVAFVNDQRPKALNAKGELSSEGEWELLRTRVEDGASIGSNATVLGGIVIGARALVGAGSVVTRDVPPDTVVAGVPARPLGERSAPPPAG
jgi:acetyltransferase-like isoleucine patch superfamily enzyme